jgi:hypothetical protein
MGIKMNSFPKEQKMSDPSEEIMSDPSEEILRHCTPKQVERVRALLAEGWQIDEYDFVIHLSKGGEFKFVPRGEETESV